MFRSVARSTCLNRPTCPTPCPLLTGVLDVDPTKPSTITAFGPGYIDKANEKIVGLQVGMGQR